MLTELSFKQDKLLAEVEAEWLSYLLDPRTVDRNAVKVGLQQLCHAFRVEPREILLAEGPLEAQCCFLEKAQQSTSSPLTESSTQRRITKKIWQPVTREVQAKVSSHLIHHVETQLGRAFFGIMRELERFLAFHLMSDSLGSGLATDAYACAFIDFFTRLGVVENSYFEAWRNSVAQGLWGSIHQGGVLIGVIPPNQCKLQLDGRRELSLHSTTSSALAWPDGTRSYWIRGTQVSREIFEEPEKVSLEQMFREWNPRTAQDIISVLGFSRFLEKTKVRVVDSDMDRAGMPRRLLRVQVTPYEYWSLVEVKCPSKGDLHYLWVPPEMERCSQAVAWTFGFEVEHYQPLIEA